MLSRADVRRTLHCGALASIPISACLLFAQGTSTATVRGRVVEATGSPVRGALVYVTRAPDSVRTSEQGSFLLLNVPAGTATLKVRALGYKEHSSEIRIEANAGWDGTVTLERVAVPLPSVEVQATEKPPELAHTTKYDDYFRRRRLGHGAFRTRDDLARLGARDIASALQGIPGLSVTATSDMNGAPDFRFRMARCPGQPPPLDLYIDGKKVLQFRQNMHEILSSIVVTDILFLEFYAGAAQVPSDLERGDACAAIVTWLR
jgi:hypothetical protein